MSWLPTTTSVGHGDLRQQVRQRVVGGDDGFDLTGERIGRTAEAERAEPTDDRHEAAERSGADHPAGGVTGHRSHAVALGVPGPRLQELLAPWLVATRRAHEGERTHPLGPQHGEDLGDATAHRGADDVSPVDADVVEDGDSVGRHLTQVVVAGRLVAAAGTAVVEGDDAVAQREDHALDVPTVLVHAEALDHQHRRCRGSSGHPVVDAAAVGGANVRHLSHHPSALATGRVEFRCGRRRRNRAAGRPPLPPGGPTRARRAGRVAVATE